ncbi:MAG: hypothetical protein IPK29_14490 [Betaproteobacteria bacterium]|nr:hypothetical protein [Betaproteobacteria bacterium]
MRLPTRLYAALLSCALTTATAHAGPGHAHGSAPTIAAASGAPRFVAESESFELVGLLEGRRLSLWLDHASSNAPVNDAVLTLDLAGNSLPVRSAGEGQFEAELAQILPVGVHTLTATVTASAQSDLLAGELDIHEGPSPQHADLHLYSVKALKYVLPVLLLAALGIVTARRLRERRTA